MSRSPGCSRSAPWVLAGLAAFLAIAGPPASVASEAVAREAAIGMPPRRSSLVLPHGRRLAAPPGVRIEVAAADAKRLTVMGVSGNTAAVETLRHELEHLFPEAFSVDVEELRLQRGRVFEMRLSPHGARPDELLRAVRSAFRGVVDVHEAWCLGDDLRVVGSSALVTPEEIARSLGAFVPPDGSGWRELPGGQRWVFALSAGLAVPTGPDAGQRVTLDVADADPAHVIGLLVTAGRAPLDVDVDDARLQAWTAFIEDTEIESVRSLLAQIAAPASLRGEGSR